MNKRILIPLLIVFLVLVGYGSFYAYHKFWEPVGVIKYSDLNQIKKEDFTAEVNFSHPAKAKGSYKIFHRFHCVDGNLRFTIYAYMDSESAWIKDEKVEESLAGQRIIFKSYELFARKLRKKLYEMEYPFSLSRTEREELVNENYQELKAFRQNMNQDYYKLGAEQHIEKWSSKLDSLLFLHKDFSEETYKK